MHDLPEKVDPPEDPTPQPPDDPIAARLDGMQKDIELALEDLEASERERRRIASRHDPGQAGPETTKAR